MTTLSTAPGNFASVNGLNLYYELHGPESGTNPPLVLLHGGVGGIEMLGPNLAALAQNRRVIAVELQGHGRTADIDRPLRCEFMADDIAALLRHLPVETADVLGYSLGGAVALQMAIRHPKSVRKLVTVSAAFRSDCWYPEVRAAMAQIGPEAAAMMTHSPLNDRYPGKDWASLFAKLGDLLRQEFDWSDAVAALEAPTMLVFADADCLVPEQIMAFYRLRGGGRGDAGWDGSARPVARLAIVPGTTHYDILATETVASLVSPFLDAPLPEDRK